MLATDETRLGLAGTYVGHAPHDGRDTTSRTRVIQNVSRHANHDLLVRLAQFVIQRCLSLRESSPAFAERKATMASPEA